MRCAAAAAASSASGGGGAELLRPASRQILGVSLLSKRGPGMLAAFMAGAAAAAAAAERISVLRESAVRIAEIPPWPGGSLTGQSQRRQRAPASPCWQRLSTPPASASECAPLSSPMDSITLQDAGE